MQDTTLLEKNTLGKYNKQRFFYRTAHERYLWSRDGAVVSALAFPPCGPGSIPGPGFICGSSLSTVLYSAPRVFLRVHPVFLLSQKSKHLNSNSIWKQWTKSYLVEMPLQIPYYYYYYYYYYYWYYYLPSDPGTPCIPSAPSELGGSF